MESSIWLAFESSEPPFAEGTVVLLEMASHGKDGRLLEMKLDGFGTLSVPQGRGWQRLGKLLAVGDAIDDPALVAARGARQALYMPLGRPTELRDGSVIEWPPHEGTD